MILDGPGRDIVSGGRGFDLLNGWGGADDLHSLDTYRNKVRCGARYDSVHRDGRDAAAS